MLVKSLWKLYDINQPLSGYVGSLIQILYFPLLFFLDFKPDFRTQNLKKKKFLKVVSPACKKVFIAKKNVFFGFFRYFSKNLVASSWAKKLKKIQFDPPKSLLFWKRLARFQNSIFLILIFKIIYNNYIIYSGLCFSKKKLHNNKDSREKQLKRVFSYHSSNN